MSAYRKELQKIKHAHEAAGLTYPRPTEICDSCKGEIVLCWGAQVSPYIKHKSGKSCENTAGESFIHKRAKQLLVSFLNRGYEISFYSNCNRCNSELTILIPDEELEFKEEVSYTSSEGKKCIFDVAGLNYTNNIIFGIEVFHKHKTDNIEPRKDIPWVEVRAIEVINVLDENKSNEFKLHSENCIVSCKDKYCLPLVNIAFALRYVGVERKYACEARRLVDIAIRGSYCKDTIVYDIEGWNKRDLLEDKPKEEVWQAFLRRECCIRCGKKNATITRGKVYCITCFKKLKKIEEDGIEEERILVADKIKKGLRVAFSWLNQVPGGWQVGSACFFCKKTYMDNEDSEKYEHLWEPNSGYISGRV
jgi:hypothetical protein